MGPIEAYIRQAAVQRGINPDIAVRVAQSEGGLNNAFNQSGIYKNGVQEPSYGPFQLLIGGGNTGFPGGLGNRAVAAGVDPRTNWQGGVDYALDEAANKGWGQWYGAAHVGISPFQGIPGHASTPYRDPMVVNVGQQQAPYAPPDGQKGQEAYAPPPSVVPGSTAVAQSPSSVPPAVQAAANPQLSRLGNLFGSLALAQQPAPQLQPVEIRGPSSDQANGLLTLLQSLKSRMV